MSIFILYSNDMMFSIGLPYFYLCFENDVKLMQSGAVVFFPFYNLSLLKLLLLRTFRHVMYNNQLNIFFAAYNTYINIKIFDFNITQFF